MGTQFKVGDVVRPKGGGLFRDGARTSVVKTTSPFLVLDNGYWCQGGGVRLELDGGEEPLETASPKPVASTGGATSYYDFPEGSSTLNDLIELKGMSFARGNIFKAVYRLGAKEGVDVEYDLNKIIYFAERLKDMYRNGQHI